MRYFQESGRFFNSSFKISDRHRGEYNNWLMYFFRYIARGGHFFWLRNECNLIVFDLFVINFFKRAAYVSLNVFVNLLREGFLIVKKFFEMLFIVYFALLLYYYFFLLVNNP